MQKNKRSTEIGVREELLQHRLPLLYDFFSSFYFVDFNYFLFDFEINWIFFHSFLPYTVEFEFFKEFSLGFNPVLTKTEPRGL